ncbi:isoprenylcysteine carboxyl methyltransferase [Seminavis robusta]|uniref:Isoprenylcysteine carboxyl methyltransferase n=1 Tax=Seminavis robusta TaxID=568900 RepID=A0A9N8D6K6_9STRA|nr:isoprenylcysteine carboxyl methyltransferase [Seminavis robusta]|eukprot:Sro18_g013090.1 isoprenylcysteine carboxyl methyltransferase (253) ;mRNA; r:145523-146281
MTSETLDKSKDDSMERPLSPGEIVGLFALVLTMYPVCLGSIFFAGAYIHSYPDSPPLWYGFWASIGGLTTVGLVSVALLLDCPRLVRQRMAKTMAGKTESSSEQLFHKLTSAVFLSAMLGMGYEGVGRRDSFPHKLVWVALAVYASSMMWIIYVFRSNKYAARIVFVQKGQQLISTGPYAIVRHPMYMGIIPMCLSLPLIVGSVWPVIPMALCAVFTGIRTYDEEEFLVRTFGDEYLDYRKKVPYRMIPLVF